MIIMTTPASDCWSCPLCDCCHVARTSLSISYDKGNYYFIILLKINYYFSWSLSASYCDLPKFQSSCTYFLLLYHCTDVVFTCENKWIDDDDDEFCCFTCV